MGAWHALRRISLPRSLRPAAVAEPAPNSASTRVNSASGDAEASSVADANDPLRRPPLDAYVEQSRLARGPVA